MFSHPKSRVFDLVLHRLPYPVTSFTSVRLPSMSVNYSGSSVVVAAFGHSEKNGTASKVLKKANFKIFDGKACKLSGEPRGEFTNKNFICAGNEKPMTYLVGNSGPLVKKGSKPTDDVLLGLPTGCADRYSS